MRTEITKVKTRGKAKSYTWYNERSKKHVPIDPDKSATYKQLNFVANRHFDINATGPKDKPVYKHTNDTIVSQTTWNEKRGLVAVLYDQLKNGTGVSALDIYKWSEAKKVPAKFVKMIDVKAAKKTKAKKSKGATTELPSAKSMIDALKALGLDVVKASK
tara:strand:+ start:29 stop:508 length:480 start_codon:yes stop_codon:yes gene_type:complete